jgi:hypothetical protein
MFGVARSRRQLHTVCGALWLVCGLSASSVWAQDEGGAVNSGDTGRPRMDVGLRVGYALPFGEHVAGEALHNLAKGAIPIQLDVSLLWPVGFSAGIYGQLSPGIQGKALNDCADCSVLAFSAGLQAAFHFNPLQSFDPWVGLGVGFEGLNVSQETSVPALTSTGSVVQVDATAHATLWSLPQIQVQAGFDFGTENFRIGPWGSVSWARATSLNSEVDCADQGLCGDEVFAERSAPVASESQANHYWVQFGLRGSYLR